jgi:hypothetical protein
MSLRCMSLRFAGITLIAGGILAAAVLRADPAGEPGSCPSDSKLLNGGPTSVFGEGPGTFWGLVIHGLIAAGFDQEAEQIGYLNQVFGTSFDNLAALEAFNLQLVSDVWDKNQNGYICAYELRGTRAHFDDPFLNLTYFGISDDKIGKN